MIEFTQEQLNDLAGWTSREWLETNGIGGFSSSTIIGLNTRRYHGLLTAATDPPVGRVVMLSKLEDVLIVDGRRFELSANQYPGVIYPQGFIYQTGFRLDPFPIFAYEVDGLLFERSIFMVQGENTVVITYELLRGAGERSVSLEVRPLIAFRDYHSTTRENSALNSTVEVREGIVTVKPYPDLPALHLAHDTGMVDPAGYWNRNFIYSVEQERGLDFQEDLFSPFSIRFDLNRKRDARIIASTEQPDVGAVDRLRTTEKARRAAVTGGSNGNSFTESLRTAAGQFVVSRGTGQTIIAGYPWFSDWGRDTMIALPGLMEIPGGPELAKRVLREFAGYVDSGMLPNRFPDAGEAPEYNTVDATLWFFEAARSLFERTDDREFVRDELYPVLCDIIDWHVKGTRYNIRLDTDGLLASGETGVQLTWMDAKVGDRVITPRWGKPVEIQALWYNALRIMQDLAERFDRSQRAEYFSELADRARDSFARVFWNEKLGCLYDVVDGDLRDASIRPNQLFAISLTHALIDGSKAEQILGVVERELLTPRGLRTLSPHDPRYVGRYEGGPKTRDGAYHQGTVWPWLMGAYLTAQLKTAGQERGRELAAEWLGGFHEHLNEAGLGQVSEIFDGDAPHTPRGCPAQAWSVTELLRVARLVGITP